jgi:hypothetical protein
MATKAKIRERLPLARLWQRGVLRSPHLPKKRYCAAEFPLGQQVRRVQYNGTAAFFSRRSKFAGDTTQNAHTYYSASACLLR